MPTCYSAVARTPAEDVACGPFVVQRFRVLPTVPTGTPIDVIVEHSEVLGRDGFSGLLAQLDATSVVAGESPEAWAPAGESRSAADLAHAQAVAIFCAWISDRREPLAS